MIEIAEQDCPCDFCGAECAAAYSTFRVPGASAAHRFCRACLDPAAPADEQRRRGAELVIVLMDRSVGEAGNVITLPGHA